MKVRVRDLADIVVLRRFHPVHYTGDDGYPAAKLFDCIGIELNDGRKFFIPNGKVLPHPEDAGQVAVPTYKVGVMVDKVLDAYEVDTDNWIELEELSFEQRMEDAWNLELRDRNDHGDFRYGYAH